MKAKDNLKLNEGCLKIFQLLTLLYEDNAYYSNVVDIFKDDLNEQSTNNIQVVLNKYMNALKVFGINVKKIKNKYQLESSLYAMDFSADDLKSLSILIEAVKNFPDDKISQDVNNLIKNLILRMNNGDKNKLNYLCQNYDFSFYYSNLREQIDQCEQICRENYSLDILYLKNNKEHRCKCTPKELLYDSKRVYFKVYDSVAKQNLEIPLDNILSIAKLPQIANPIELPTTVVYKLKNRLAKTYKIKENEYSDGYDEDGNLIVINKNEPFDLLLNRLMRYTYNCEIISPKQLRDKMIEKINETLKNYES